MTPPLEPLNPPRRMKPLPLGWQEQALYAVAAVTMLVEEADEVMVAAAVAAARAEREGPEGSEDGDPPG